MDTLFDYSERIYNNMLIDQTAVVNERATEIIKENSFRKLLKDESLCMKLIDAIIEDDDAVVVRYNQNRASHILITWLLGIGFGKVFKFNIFDHDDAFLKNYYYRLWSLTAMIHDYGYFEKEMQKSGLDLYELTKQYNLLTDKYDVHDKDINKAQLLQCLNNLSSHDYYKKFFSYTYDEIKGYYKYSQEYHLNNPSEDGEMSDHGIVGGCIVFSKYCKKCLKSIIKGLYPSNTITIQQKIACFTAASHNVFKSPNKDIDKSYIKAGLTRLLSFSPKIVTKDNTLLSLLSLVDTVECTKRFSKKSNPKQYLVQETVLKNICIEEYDQYIIVDFSKLADYIQYERKNGEMIEKLRKHIDGILSISSWTDYLAFPSDIKNPYILVIKNNSI